MFAHPVVSAVWKTVEAFVEQGRELDPISLADNTEGVDPAFLSGTLVEQSTLSDPTEVSQVVRDSYIARQIRLLPVDLEELDPAEQLRRVNERVERLEQSMGRRLPTLGEITQQEVERALSGESPAGLPCGLGIPRVVPGGIPRDKVTVLFGESGNFKTTVKNALMINMAREGCTVLDASLEDSNELTAQRYLASITNISYGTFSDPSALLDRERTVLQSVDPAELSSRVLLGGDIAPNIDEIIRLARYYKRERGLSAVFIDYIQLLEGQRRFSEREMLTYVMRKCQNAAKRDKVAYILVSQANRNNEYREATEKRPKPGDLFGSSTLHQYCKLLIGVYRPSKYNYEPPSAKNAHPLDRSYRELFTVDPSFEREYSRLLELHVLKNVVGETAVVHADVDAPTGVVTESDIRGRL
jgi:replicative DNA helicase